MVPTVKYPNPRDKIPGMNIQSLSNPAAVPTGLFIFIPQYSVVSSILLLIGAKIFFTGILKRNGKVPIF